MSFTVDELQSLNDILEQKLTMHCRELERNLDQRLTSIRRDFEQRLNAAQQEIIRSLTQQLAEQQRHSNLAFTEKLTMQQLAFTQQVSQEIRQRFAQSHQYGQPGAALSTQLHELEQRLDQGLFQAAIPSTEQLSQIEAIEVQTDISWDDLTAIFDNALEQRLISLQESLQATLQEWGQALKAQLQPPTRAAAPQNMEEVFQSIEQLERMIESMQVAMTANTALLSNRLYQHQQFPADRAHGKHTAPETETPQPNGADGALPAPKSNE